MNTSGIFLVRRQNIFATLFRNGMLTLIPGPGEKISLYPETHDKNQTCYHLTYLCGPGDLPGQSLANETLTQRLALLEVRGRYGQSRIEAAHHESRERLFSEYGTRIQVAFRETKRCCCSQGRHRGRAPVKAKCRIPDLFWLCLGASLSYFAILAAVSGLLCDQQVVDLAVCQWLIKETKSLPQL